MRRGPRSHRSLAAGVAALALLVGCSAATSAPEAARPGRGESAGGIGSCALSSLPPEASTTVELIHADGPFPYPRNDGVVFGNREGLLPAKSSGWYHEYTVPTPGASNRGARRVITGGTPLTSPPDYYYTADHYESFCAIGGAER